MKRLNPEKLHVKFRPCVTSREPIIPRRYTLTHSDVTAELFLTIGPTYAYDEIGPMRDEVLAEWRLVNGQYMLYVYVYVGGEFGRENAARRCGIFTRELPLALEAIRYGDRKFFRTHKELDNAPIWIYFHSIYPYYNRMEYWKTPRDYK